MRKAALLGGLAYFFAVFSRDKEKFLEIRREICLSLLKIQKIELKY